jgi:chromosome segregation protein
MAARPITMEAFIGQPPCPGCQELELLCADLKGALGEQVQCVLRKGGAGRERMAELGLKVVPAVVIENLIRIEGICPSRETLWKALREFGLKEYEREPSIMHLEDVTIEGFKSFSEPTSMSFQPGIGVIIGNNGVGKSNILDAIVWTLGENDLVKLRLLEREELFFAGNKVYPPASRVRVELVFKEGPVEKSPEIRLVRTVSRDGQETWQVQGETVSPAVYRKKLKALGLVDSVNTIIRQEQINDLLTLLPADRLHWIQGLAGKKTADSLPEELMTETDPLFQRYLRYLFPEGEGRLLIVEGKKGKGLEVEVAVKGKLVRRGHQLSGGEKAITSLALKLALFERLPSPFYLLDEVEPALDYLNHKSMQALLKELAAKKHLIMVTHLRSTIALANTLHGVRTRMDGSSFMKFYFVMNERLLRLYKCC